VAAVRQLQSTLNALKVLVGNFPATAYKDTEILLGTPSTDGLGVALDPPGSGGHASGFSLSHSGLLWIKGARMAATAIFWLTEPPEYPCVAAAKAKSSDATSERLVRASAGATAGAFRFLCAAHYA
jgi:hypothetical protein